MKFILFRTNTQNTCTRHNYIYRFLSDLKRNINQRLIYMSRYFISLWSCLLCILGDIIVYILLSVDNYENLQMQALPISTWKHLWNFCFQLSTRSLKTHKSIKIKPKATLILVMNIQICRRFDQIRQSD